MERSILSVSWSNSIRLEGRLDRFDHVPITMISPVKVNYFLQKIYMLQNVCVFFFLGEGGDPPFQHTETLFTFTLTLFLKSISTDFAFH